MADVSKLKRRTLGAPPPPTEASTNLAQPEGPSADLGVKPPPLQADVPASHGAPANYDRLDGRSLRRSNRIVQFATRVTPEFDRRIREIARDEHLLIVEVLERALDVYEKQQQDISQKAARSSEARR